MQAMIMAAGLGTRLKPITENFPKALVKINDETLLSLLIKKLISAGVDTIVINIHHLADQIQSYLDQNHNFNSNIFISDEREELLDTGGGLKKAQIFFDNSKPILIHNVDIISDIDLNKFYEFHITKKCLATLAVRNRKSSRYFLFNDANLVCGWENLKTGENKLVRKDGEKLTRLAFSGVQIVDPKIFLKMPDDKIFSLVDLYLSAAKNYNIKAYLHDEDNWFDVGNTDNLKSAEKFLIKR